MSSNGNKVKINKFRKEVVLDQETEKIEIQTVEADQEMME
jgi:hypothetical protein